MAAATERARRVSDSSIAALRSAGLFRLLQPPRYGGYGHDLEHLVHIGAALGRACGSTAWVYTVFAGHALHVGMFGGEAQDDVWGNDPDALVASSYVPAGAAKRVAGGYRLTGTWPYSSGCDSAAWFLIGIALASESGPPELRFTLVPRADVAFDDNWHTTGLAGTGSKNLILSDVFVPEHRTLGFREVRENPPGAAFHGHPLYRLPFFAVSSYCLLTPALGLAQGAIADFIAEAKSRPTRSFGAAQSARLGDHPAIQTRLAEAAGLVDAAMLLTLRDCRATMAAVRAGGLPAIEQRARNKRDQALAVRLVKQATQLIVEAAGTRAIFIDHPVMRAARDIQAIATHITLTWDVVGPVWGRVALGNDPGVPL